MDYAAKTSHFRNSMSIGLRKVRKIKIAYRATRLEIAPLSLRSLSLHPRGDFLHCRRNHRALQQLSCKSGLFEPMICGQFISLLTASTRSDILSLPKGPPSRRWWTGRPGRSTDPCRCRWEGCRQASWRDWMSMSSESLPRVYT